MTDRVFIITTCIVTIPPTVLATATLISSLRGQKMSAQRQEKTDAKIDTVHNELNGRLSQLLKAENAQGRQDERDSR